MTVAIDVLEVSMKKRSQGDSAVAAAAYRAGVDLEDRRAGERHRYSRRQPGIQHTELLVPDGEDVPGREELWNQAEERERRKDSQVAREFMVALPHELEPEAQNRLARRFAQEVVRRYDVAADVAVHRPHPRDDQRNVHAHVLTTRRRLEDGELTETVKELNPWKAGDDAREELSDLRDTWLRMQRRELVRARDGDRSLERVLEAVDQHVRYRHLLEAAEREQ